jgi:four helix bundle protein
MTQFDLEERTFLFAEAVKNFAKDVPQTLINQKYIDQVIRSSSSISANYLEASDALGRDDFLYRLRISRKEAKETRLWLRLIDVNGNADLEKRRQILMQEATELRLILSTMIANTQQKTANKKR